MPVNSIAHVDYKLLVRSCALGTGGVGKWRSVTTDLVLAECIATAPIGKPENAAHRGGFVGEYKTAFDADHRGTRGLRFIGRITNNAPHAKYVEEGRSASRKDQFFAWGIGTAVYGGNPGGDWYVRNRPRRSADRYPIGIFKKTRAREGMHIMRNAGQRVAATRHAAWHGRDL